MKVKKIKAKLDNPLSELISDEIYELLSIHKLINNKAARDYQLRMKIKYLRSNNLSISDAIDALRKDYPYLQSDTIRKIVYRIYVPTTKEKYKI